MGQARGIGDAVTGGTPADIALEQAILTLLAARAPDATICPSEAARRVACERGHPGDEGWRQLMDAVRAAAQRLVVRGEVEIVQRGRVVDPSTARGPLRIRRGPRWWSSKT